MTIRFPPALRLGDGFSDVAVLPWWRFGHGSDLLISATHFGYRRSPDVEIRPVAGRCHRDMHRHAGARRNVPLLDDRGRAWPGPSPRQRGAGQHDPPPNLPFSLLTTSSSFRPRSTMTPLTPLPGNFSSARAFRPTRRLAEARSPNRQPDSGPDTRDRWRRTRYPHPRR